MSRGPDRRPPVPPAGGGEPLSGIDRALRGPAGYLAVLLIALAVRALYLTQISASPFFDHPILDARVYDGYAVRIAAGETPVAAPFYHPPLYPYFLGALYAVFGRDLFLVRLAQCLLGAVNVLLTLYLANRFLRPKAAFACGLAAALFGTMIFYEAELLAPVLIVFLDLLLCASALSFLARPRPLAAAACGVTLGLSALAMPVVLPLAVVLPCYAVVGTRRQGTAPRPGRGLLCGLVFLGGIAAVVAPVTARNARYGDPVLIAYNGGVNMFIGTGPDYDAKVGARPGPVWDGWLREPVRAGRVEPSAQSAYFVEKSLEIIKGDPVGYAALLAKKAWLFFRGDEIMRNQEIYPFRQYSPVLAALLWKRGVAFPSGLLMPLALLGAILVVARRDWRAGLLVAFVGCHVAVLLLFFVTARYRVAVVPFLLILAGLAAQWFAAALRDRRWRGVAAAAAAFGVLAVASNARSGAMPRAFSTDSYYNLGVAFREEGRPGAKALFARALEVDPGNGAARIHLGSYYDLEGDPRAALREYEIVLRREPGNLDALFNRALALHHLGQDAAAIAGLRGVLAIEPGHAAAARALGHLEAGRPAVPPQPR